MVGRVPSSVRAGARELVIGIGTRDAARLIRGYQLLGVLLPGADLELLARRAHVFERYGAQHVGALDAPRGDAALRPNASSCTICRFRAANFNLAGAAWAILSMCTGLDPHQRGGLMPVAQKARG
jgi:hypothetical protein